MHTRALTTCCLMLAIATSCSPDEEPDAKPTPADSVDQDTDQGRAGVVDDWASADASWQDLGASETKPDTTPDTTTADAGTACPEGKACDDDDPCTDSDTCAAGKCVGKPLACGGAQVALARTLFLAVFAGNEAVFDYDPETLQEVGDQLGAFAGADKVPFEDIGDGLWRMKNTAGTSTGVSFDVRFHDHKGGPMSASPFLLESYLEGLTVQHALTWEQMKAAPQTPNTYTITWQKLGPLGLTLGGPRGEVPNPIVLHISAMDFLAVVQGVGSSALFGPFAQLLNVGLSSRVNLVQHKGSASVHYDMRAPREALRTAALKSVVAFQVVGMSVTAKGRALHSDGASHLGFEDYSLVGSLTLRGALESGGKVEVDLGYKYTNYADQTWRCQ